MSANHNARKTASTDLNYIFTSFGKLQIGVTHFFPIELDTTTVNRTSPLAV
jgi:hypothetical protein